MRTNWSCSGKQRAIIGGGLEVGFCAVDSYNTEKPRHKGAEVINSISVILKYSEKEYNILTELVIRLAIEVHRDLGPGLLESVYEACLVKLLKDEGMRIKTQVKVPIIFRNEKLVKILL